MAIHKQPPPTIHIRLEGGPADGDEEYMLAPVPPVIIRAGCSYMQRFDIDARPGEIRYTFWQPDRPSSEFHH